MNARYLVKSRDTQSKRAFIVSLFLLLLLSINTPLYADPHPIEDAQTLQDIQNNLNGEYYLANDIDCSDFEGFEPIGDGDNPFAGSFNGNGHIIRNLTIDMDGGNNVGLFASTENAVIQNVGIVNIIINGEDNVGGLVGSSGESEITNCSVMGEIRGLTNVGGLVGSAASSTINTSHSRGAVTCEDSGCGGLVGLAENATITNSYAAGSVEGDDAGGLVGLLEEENTFNNNFWDTETTGQNQGTGQGDEEGIEGKTTREMRDQDTFTDWDFENIWVMAGYPHLRIGFRGEPVTQTIDLEEDWNIISFYVEPPDMSMLDILWPLRDSEQLDLVKNENGRFIFGSEDGEWFDNIGNMAVTEGYKIKVNENTSLTVVGSAVPLPAIIPLRQGWNITGYPCTFEQSVEEVLESLIDDEGNKVDLVKDEDGNFIFPEYDYYDGFQEFLPGKGYQIKLNRPGELVIYDILTVNWPDFEVGAESYELTGRKRINAGIFVNGREFNDFYEQERWTCEVDLPRERENQITVLVIDNLEPPNEREVQGTIIRDMTPPRLDVNWPPPDEPVEAETYNLTGTKEPGATLVINGDVIDGLREVEDWEHEINLNEGENNIIVFARDNAVPANQSQAQEGTIIRDTTPRIIEVLDDGEFTNDRTELHGSWSAEERGIQIVEYQYAIGTTQGEEGNDIVDWTSVDSDTREVTVTDLELTVGQIYYFNVKARNDADLWSDVASSDGITVLNQAPIIDALRPLLEDNAIFIGGGIIGIEVDAYDDDGDDLQYYYSVDGHEIQDWTGSASCSWQTRVGDLRLKTITVQVRDEYIIEEDYITSSTNVFLVRETPLPEDEQ